jgi:hypothetical protein
MPVVFGERDDLKIREPYLGRAAGRECWPHCGTVRRDALPDADAECRADTGAGCDATASWAGEHRVVEIC